MLETRTSRYSSFREKNNAETKHVWEQVKVKVAEAESKKANFISLGLLSSETKVTQLMNKHNDHVKTIEVSSLFLV